MADETEDEAGPRVGPIEQFAVPRLLQPRDRLERRLERGVHVPGDEMSVPGDELAAAREVRVVGALAGRQQRLELGEGLVVPSLAHEDEESWDR